MQRLSVEYVNEAKEYYLYNGTGNATQTTAENGSAFLRYTYDAFGNISSIRAPMTVDIDDLNRYTYNGEDYDYNTDLQYLRARYYRTGTGNFISQDTYLGDLLNPLSQNRYTYSHNSPVMFDDPSGHDIVVVSGGEYDASDTQRDGQYQFINSALNKIEILSQESDERIVLMIADTGLSDSEVLLIQLEYTRITGDSAEDNVTFFTDANEVVNEINDRAGDVDKERKITGFYSYSHGLSTKIDKSVSYGYHSELSEPLRLTADIITENDSSAFAEDAVSEFYSCRTGKGKDSLAQLWADTTLTSTKAATGRTNYILWRATPSEGEIKNYKNKYNDIEKYLNEFNLFNFLGYCWYKEDTLINWKNNLGVFVNALEDADEMNEYIEKKSEQALMYSQILACLGYGDVEEIPYPAYAQPILAMDYENRKSSWKTFEPNN